LLDYGGASRGTPATGESHDHGGAHSDLERDGKQAPRAIRPAGILAAMGPFFWHLHFARNHAEESQPPGFHHIFLSRLQLRWGFGIMMCNSTAILPGA
jgi:hypothetical protein